MPDAMSDLESCIQAGEADPIGAPATQTGCVPPAQEGAKPALQPRSASENILSNALFFKFFVACATN